MRDVPSILKQDVPIVKADHTERREHLEKSRLPADDEAGEAKNREDKEGEDRLWSVQHKHKAEGVRSQSVKFREDIHVGEPAWAGIHQLDIGDAGEEISDTQGAEDHTK